MFFKDWMMHIYSDNQCNVEMKACILGKKMSIKKYLQIKKNYPCATIIDFNNNHNIAEIKTIPLFYFQHVISFSHLLSIIFSFISKL